ncbi:hypothetical protein BSZ39_05920 [Bowdeniella nasicola]|uniref:Uncharacterized protein n=1 Tax=Bowdeniella nasicola TaxID=208480 RepID=A0A1Q5Q2L9_9ACTO|nr:DUF6882 domain-containing protein [Bowdeniella nasicola]OKL54098.1 hypothetical protein BSZ39_05920 [Bowdeniella nasicola]
MAFTLAELVDRAAFMSAETQLALEDLVGDLPWQVDLSERPTLTWGEGADAITTTPSLLGSVAAKSHTWHWGWDNINNFPDAVVARAREVKTRAQGTQALTTEELSVADNPHLPLELTLAAKALTGVWAHYAASAGPDTDVWFLLEHPDLTLGEPSAVSVGRVIAQGLSTIPVSDHRAALREYAKARGFTVSEEEEAITLHASDGKARVELASDRIVNISLSAADVDERPDEEAAAATVPPMEREVPEMETTLEPEAEKVDAIPDEASGLEAEPDTGEEAPPAPAEPAAEEIEPVEAPSSLERGPEDEPPATEPAAHVPSEAERITPVEEEKKPEKKKGFFSRIFGSR